MLISYDMLDQFIGNYQALRHDFRLTDNSLKRIAAFGYAVENKEIALVRIKEQLENIRKKTGVFSAFRGTIEFYLAALFALYDNRPELLDRSIAIYDRLRQETLPSNDYLTLSAFIFAMFSDEENIDKAIIRTKAIYLSLKRKHTFHPEGNDYISCTLMGLTQKPVEIAVQDTLAIRKALAESLLGPEGQLTLAQLLASMEVPESDIGRYFTITNLFREYGIKVNRQTALFIPGVLTAIPGDEKLIVTEALRVVEYLRAQNGFGEMSVQQNELLLYAASFMKLHSARMADPTNATYASGTLVARTTGIIVSAVIVPTMAAITVTGAQ